LPVCPWGWSMSLRVVAARAAGVLLGTQVRAWSGQ
jgi:hypothetical protein